MGITNSNKQINVDRIDCDGTLRVTLALSASPDISTNPTDIVLVLDRSGSMAGSPLANMKAGAKTFIDIIDEATDSAQDGNIGSGSRIGIVSFSDTAVANTQLITSVDTLKDAVDSLTAGGSTNHADAFQQATQLFDPLSANAKVIVMFTDGKTTSGVPPAPIAAAARASGVIIYCIGLIGLDGIDINVLNDWATDPDASHVAVTPNDEDLEQLFKDLAANISKTGATDIVIDEIVNSDFTITSLTPPTKGTAMMTDSHTIQWKIPELGVTANEGASLEFLVRHTAQDSGEKLVNQSISYSDNEGNVVVFPEPSVLVDCGIVVHPEPCPIPVDLTAESCQDSIIIDAGDAYLQSLGRILQMDVTVKNVCPGKRVALAIVLTEVDPNGLEYSRGMKTLTIPAHDYPSCRDVLVKCVKFVLPEDLDVSGGIPTAMCSTRSFKVRLIAHNIDTDYQCCDSIVTIL
ncbi:VWA domain-containing protein [Massilimaliae timonensis]|uniref:VWA domain-containing protein n=1 Tax=Massiliimalia timonensis TaxID=1987501 RepID=A0A8J6PLQ3_9FIRM|nr:vWA domain-containing protein [Massiliimalia timonensis]MBC8611915.1 VWA domain-containing protein [Massiliimalia timonensis]